MSSWTENDFRTLGNLLVILFILFFIFIEIRKHHPHLLLNLLPNKRSILKIMDVTRNNFMQVLPDLEQRIKDADFVSIDSELTGLRRDKLIHMFDTQEERYLKMKNSSMEYSIIQFGLSCFKRVIGTENHYECHSYNFYIFPYKVANVPYKSEKSFLVQSSALSFLGSHGFDFNKLIKEGINWMSEEEELNCKEALSRQEESNNSPDHRRSPFVPEEHKDFITEIFQKVNKFVVDDSRETLELPVCSAYRRKIIYEHFKSLSLNDKIEMQTVPISQNSQDRFILVVKVNKEKKAIQLKNALTESVGFSQIIKLLIKYQKRLIGHNLLLDLLHMINQFIKPLPDTYDEFKALISSSFPFLYDTKFIASSASFKEIIKNTSLSELHERLQLEPFKPINLRITNDSPRNLHEAGYDSYLTGSCFLSFMKYFERETSSKSHFEGLEEFENKLHVSYTFDIPYLYLHGKEKPLDRNHVFHIKFPQKWTSSNLYQLFSAYGNISIAWLSDVTAFIGLKDPTKAKIVKESFKKIPDKSEYSIQSYQQFMKVFNNGSNIVSKRKSTSEKSDAPNSPVDIKPTKKSKLDKETFKEVDVWKT